MSFTLSAPLALSVESSRTVAAAVPVTTAASLVPLIVKLTSFSVPSAEVMMKLSTLLSVAPRYCTRLLATV